MNIEIKPMQENDIDKVMVIENAVFTSPWIRRGFESELGLNRYSRYYVAHAQGELLGYAGMWIVLNEAHLTTLAVSSENQRKGIGSLLLHTLLGKAAREGVVRMFLEVRPSNMPAKNLYAKFGFHARGKRKNYYVDEDAVIMVNENIAEAGRSGKTVETK